jgi:hypothetical protein
MWGTAESGSDTTRLVRSKGGWAPVQAPDVDEGGNDD